MAEHSDIKPAHAYVFVKVNPSRTAHTVEQLRAIRGTMVREVLGPWDVVVEVEADGPEYITHIVRRQIRTLDGVLETVTCQWIE